MIQDMDDDEYGQEDDQQLSDSLPPTRTNNKRARFQNSSEESDIINTDQDFDSGIN
jgi:hypothetical protein